MARKNPEALNYSMAKCNVGRLFCKSRDTFRKISLDETSNISFYGKYATSPHCMS